MAYSSSKVFTCKFKTAELGATIAIGMPEDSKAFDWLNQIYANIPVISAQMILFLDPLQIWKSLMLCLF